MTLPPALVDAFAERIGRVLDAARSPPPGAAIHLSRPDRPFGTSAVTIVFWDPG